MTGPLEPRELPLKERLLDLLAFVSIAAIIANNAVGLWMRRQIFSHTAEARAALTRMWPSLLISLIIVISLVLTMLILMLVDCANQISGAKRRRYIIWLVIMCVCFPAAWVYYFIERRPRGRRAGQVGS